MSKKCYTPTNGTKKTLIPVFTGRRHPPTIAITCTPYKRKGKWIPPIFATDIPPYKRKGIPPYNRKRKIWTVDHVYEAERSIYKLKHRQVCYVHKASTWDNRGLKKRYKGKQRLYEEYKQRQIKSLYELKKGI